MDTGTQSDESLVRMFREGNERAFGELYSRYERKLKKLIYSISPGADDVEDIFHETIVKVIKYIDHYDESKPFGAWIYRIAVNCGRNHLKRARRDTEVFEQERFRVAEGDAEPSPDDLIIAEEDMREFNAAVNSLKERFREVFLLRYANGMKFAEIAHALGCSERTAKWRMEKAVEMITDILKKKGII